VLNYSQSSSPFLLSQGSIAVSRERRVNQDEGLLIFPSALAYPHGLVPLQGWTVPLQCEKYLCLKSYFPLRETNACIIRDIFITGRVAQVVEQLLSKHEA
jgi:hypothetical protein